MTGSSALATTVKVRSGSASVVAQWSRVRSSETPRVYSREAFISTTQRACVSRAIGPSTISSTSSTAWVARRVCDRAMATPSRMLDPPELNATGPAVDRAAASIVAAVLLPLVALTRATGMSCERTEMARGLELHRDPPTDGRAVAEVGKARQPRGGPSPQRGHSAARAPGGVPGRASGASPPVRYILRP